MAGVDDELDGVDPAELAARRDAVLNALLAAKARDRTPVRRATNGSRRSCDAIDVHVHVEQDGHGCFALDQELMDASAAYFRPTRTGRRRSRTIAEHYRARNIAAVVFTVDAPAGTGHPALSSEEIADAAAEHADVLIPFGSVDPHAGKAAVPGRAGS